MNRRTVFKHLAVASAAALLLPSCVSDPKKVSVALNNLNVTGDEEDLLGDIADVIIPTTETPGARDVQAHLFALIMVDDCLAKPEQEKYLKGMRTFNEVLKSATGKSFTTASPEERFKMLTHVELHQDEVPEETRTFYNRTRAYLLQGYLSSQHFLTDVKPYQLIPGHFNGCIPLSGESKTIS